MLDLEKEVKRLNGYIKNTMSPDDRQIEVDAYHAMEMLERAITAEKALELIAEAVFELMEGCGSSSNDCPAYEYCQLSNGDMLPCVDKIIEWALEKAREQG